MSPVPVDDVAKAAAAGLREGTLKLRDVVGLSDAELHAVAEAAAALQRSGQLAEARAAIALLLLYDPMSARTWTSMADLHHGVGDHAVAVACYETAAMLGGRQQNATRREVHSLEQLGQPALAGELVELAARQDAAERGES